METTEEKKLTKALGAFDITLMGLGIIIGTGIFVLTGIGAAKYAGPGLMLSFVLAAVTCTFVCLAYSELASFLPVSGSSYTYAYASLGEVFGWWVGWSLILEYSVGASAVAGGWSAYFVGILHSCGIDLPKALTAVPAEGGLINLPAAFIVLVTTALLVIGVKESTRVNRILVYIKIGTIFVFLFFGIVSVLGAYFVAAHDIRSWYLLLPAVSAGAFSVAVLNVNNIRDMATDAATRQTVPLMIGVRMAKVYQTVLILGGWVCMLLYAYSRIFSLWHYLFVVTLPLFAVHLAGVWRRDGRALDPMLPLLVISTFLFCLLGGLGFIVFLF